jgi:hypothetical protein
MKGPRIGLVAICAFLGSAIPAAQPARRSAIFTCHEISRARPGRGVSYRGTVQNSDYNFSATIPDGLTGWGSAPGAPFHGFTVYLDKDQKSCISFEISIRVLLPEDEATRNSGAREARAITTRVKIGNRVGVQAIETGEADGLEFENLTISLGLPRNGYQNDAVVIFVTPKTKADQTNPLLGRFLSSFRFW